MANDSPGPRLLASVRAGLSRRIRPGRGQEAWEQTKEEVMTVVADDSSVAVYYGVDPDMAMRRLCFTPDEADVLARLLIRGVRESRASRHNAVWNG